MGSVVFLLVTYIIFTNTYLAVAAGTIRLAPGWDRLVVIIGPGGVILEPKKRAHSPID
jgi:hypothetical protein